MTNEQVLYNMAAAHFTKGAAYGEGRENFQPGFVGEMGYTMAHPLNAMQGAAGVLGNMFSPAPAQAAAPQAPAAVPSPYETKNQQGITNATGFGGMLNQINNAGQPQQ